MDTKESCTLVPSPRSLNHTHVKKIKQRRICLVPLKQVDPGFPGRMRQHIIL